MIAFLATIALAAHYYCTPTACPNQPGTPAAPWGLEQCLDQSNGAVAGDTIEFLPGQYDCSPCDFRHDDVLYSGYGAELVDDRHGAHTVHWQTVRAWCDDCDLHGFDVRNTNYSPTTETPTGVSLYGQGVWLHEVDVTSTYNGIHVAHQPLPATKRAYISEVWVYDVGANYKGHGLYLQGPATVEASLIENAAHYGIQVYGSQTAANITIRTTATRGSRLCGFVIGGAEHQNILIEDSAFISRPPYTKECVAVQSNNPTGLTVRRSFLMGGVQMQTPGDPSLMILEDNLLFGGNRPGGAHQVPAWDFTWTAADYCAPERYCAWECAYPDNVWTQRGLPCECACP